jgi:hypothetical protein
MDAITKIDELIGSIIVRCGQVTSRQRQALISIAECLDKGPVIDEVLIADYAKGRGEATSEGNEVTLEYLDECVRLAR